MTKVIVAGAAGFIGRRVVAVLREHTDWKIIEFDRNTAPLPDVDVDYLINLAADADAKWTIEHPVDSADNTVGIAARLLDYTTRHVRRFVQVSSVEVYGTGTCDHTVDCALRPQSPYAANKAAQDLLALASAQAYGIDVVVARIGNVFGATQPASRLLPVLVRRACNGEPLTVVPGLRRFTHVDDVAIGLWRVLTESTDQIVHLTGDQLIDHLTFADLVRAAVGSTSPIELVTASRPGQFGDISGVPSTVANWSCKPLVSRIDECVTELI